MNRELYLGCAPLRASKASIEGAQVAIGGEDFYRISNYDRMRPFLMSIVSSADHWMFISSTGGLTAGRRDADAALFPYYTEDKIHDSAENTGSKTILIVRQNGKSFLWEPFSERCRGIYRIKRNLYKSFPGNQLIFEEINEDLALTFRYGWTNSERFGLVRKASLSYSGKKPTRINLLDGIQNLVPAGVGSQLQLEKSVLVDAYKKNELLPETGLALFTLSAIIVDRPEPAESLKATTVWSLGLSDAVRLLSSIQLDCFRQGLPLREKTDIRAERGAYFLQSEFTLRNGREKNWFMVADVNRGPSQVAELDELLRKPAALAKSVDEDIRRGTEELRRLVANADGIQKSADALGDARHFNNVLFNIMRGGVFRDGCRVDASDLRDFVAHANHPLAARHANFFKKSARTYSEMVSRAAQSGDANLERLCREYLPLTFSRRHGDPSRPWNRFSIPGRNADGARMLNYEGNWRDIFQNWEALALSFPDFIAGMICRFVNASTPDGYNPYRISRDGIDWEVVDPHDPWSHIGYWGDHQIIYLLKLLEALHRHEPDTLRELLTREIFCYANVPYRIKPYKELRKDPKATVEFDQSVENLVRQRVQKIGADGKLVLDGRDKIQLVNLAEKLLVPILAKLSNFVPEAGIWLNTQRPEWNDANNALVGQGVSVVTLCYLRRHLDFCLEIFRVLEKSKIQLSDEVAEFLQSLGRILTKHRALLGTKITDAQRKDLLDQLGKTGSRYREQIYANGFSGQKTRVKAGSLLDFFHLALEWTDHSIRANRRDDGLYHAYNLIVLGRNNSLPIRRLHEMLEGQVAALSSGSLSAEESLHVLTALKQSAMYRADQLSYLLYPDRQLRRFTEKNNIPKAAIAHSKLLQKLISDDNRVLVERDVHGQCHFNGSIANARDVERLLSQLAASGYGGLVRRESKLVLEIFEHLFDHQSFTGRSGTFFGYEGLGSIYWHMVSKLLLAAQETFFRAADAGAPKSTLKKLADCYHDIRAGIGDRKSPEVYGAFPMDPYSHTPAHAGARQPGLTGQVKEDILCRMGELGVFVREGKIHFKPLLLRKDEFLATPGTFAFFDVAGNKKQLRLKPHCLAFTYCQTPVIYRLAAKDSIEVSLGKNESIRQDALCLDETVSRSIFRRTGRVTGVTVYLNKSGLE